MNLSPDLVTSIYEKDEVVSENLEDLHNNDQEDKPRRPNETEVKIDTKGEKTKNINKRNTKSKTSSNSDYSSFEDKKLITKLTNENIDLKKSINSLLEEDLNNSININKLKSQKFIIFSELNELIAALKQVDLKKLDKYFELNSKLHKTLNKKSISSSMGISYNIMSAQHQLGLISQADLVNIQLYNELEKIKNQVNNNQEENISQEHTRNTCTIQGLANNCDNVLKDYEADFEVSINKVLNKIKPQSTSYESI